MTTDRFYCPLSPCRPSEVLRPDAYGSASFTTREAYLRHVERGHYIAAVNAPLPFMTAEDAMRRYLEDGR